MRHLTHSGRENFSACVAMMVVTTVLVMARFAVRASHRQALMGSDWTCLLSLAFFYAYCSVLLNFILHTSQYGSLDSNVALGVVEVKNLLKMTFAAELLMGMVITSVKISILWFYYKAFVTPQDRLKKHVIRGTMAACLVWFICVTFFIIFTCNPIHAYWDMFGQAPYCKSSVRFLLGYEISNLFLDVFILVIPIPILLGLQMQQSRKLSLIGIFLLGTFACAASIVRITTIWNPPNVDANFKYPLAMMWSTLQMGITITCACLPTLAPIIPAIAKQFSQARSWTSIIWTRSRTRASSGNNGYKISQDEYEMSRDAEQPETQVAKSHGYSQSWAASQGHVHHGHDVERFPSNTVLVERDVRVAY